MTDKKTRPDGPGPTMTSESTFRFRCHPGVPCFTNCCRDITIFLTPHDVLRLKRKLALSSYEFLDQYTYILYKQGNPFPLVQLRMSDEEGRPCMFVDREKGCRVYEERPWACRIYPLDIVDDTTFRQIVGDDVCQGFREDREWVVSEWMQNQGVGQFDELDYRYSMLTGNPQVQEHELDNDRVREMILMAAYDLDRFRRFVFESRFLAKFDLPEEEVELLKNDDVELLKLGFRWLGFGLINPMAIRIKPEVISEFMGKKDKS